MDPRSLDYSRFSTAQLEMRRDHVATSEKTNLFIVRNILPAAAVASVIFPSVSDGACLNVVADSPPCVPTYFFICVTTQVERRARQRTAHVRPRTHLSAQP